MPKLPGRASTRKTIELSDAVCASFLFPWDRANKGMCCIKGCDHRTDGMIGELGDGEFCSHGNSAVIYNETLMPGPTPDPYVGIACPHHTDLILESGN